MGWWTTCVARDLDGAHLELSCLCLVGGLVPGLEVEDLLPACGEDMLFVSGRSSGVLEY